MLGIIINIIILVHCYDSVQRQHFFRMQHSDLCSAPTKMATAKMPWHESSQRLRFWYNANTMKSWALFLLFVPWFTTGHEVDAIWLDRAILAAEAVRLLQEPMTTETSFDTIQWYRDESSLAVIATHATGCYAALHKSRTNQFWSYASSLVTSSYETVCSSNETTNETTDSCCSIRNQWVDAYDTSSWRVEFEADLVHCSTERPVILSGHQFGAGVAQVAAVRLHTAVNPYFISFGQPRVTGSACLVGRDKWIRFVNTREDLRLHIVWLVYDTSDDLSPGLWTRNAANAGHLYVMSGNDLEHWAYLGLDASGPRRPRDWSEWSGRMTTNESTNVPTLGFDSETEVFGYYDRLVATRSTIMSSSGTAISIRGFRDRALCTMNVECQSQHCARREFDAPFRCQPLQD